MEECNICCFKKKPDKFITMTCGNKLCKKCYINLIRPACPFCRNKITYTEAEKKQRIKQGVDVNYNFYQNIEFNLQDLNNNNIATSHISNSNNMQPNNRTRHYDLNLTSILNNYDTTIQTRTERRRNQRMRRNQHLEFVTQNSNQETANNRRRRRSRRRRVLSDSEITNRRKKIKARQKRSRERKNIRSIKTSGNWYY